MKRIIILISMVTIVGCFTVTKNYEIAGLKIKCVSSTPDRPLTLTLENSNEFTVFVKAICYRTKQGFLGGSSSYEEIQWIRIIEAKQILNSMRSRWPVMIFVSKEEKVIGAIKVNR